jgi:uncharacterized protein (DUF2384 family)
MNTSILSAKTSNRSAALAALWAMLDAPDQGEPSPAPTRVMVGARLAGLSSVGACKLLKRGISSQDHSAESVLRLLELGQMAADTFETEDEASAWLRRAHPVLEGDSPLEAAKTSFGAQRVKDILIAIRYGGVV